MILRYPLSLEEIIVDLNCHSSSSWLNALRGLPIEIVSINYFYKGLIFFFLTHHMYFTNSVALDTRELRLIEVMII